MRVRLDGMSLAGVALLLLFAVNIVRGWAGEGQPITPPPEGVPAQPQPVAPVAAELPTQAEQPAAPVPPAADPAWLEQIAMPYDEYFLTQGIHGQMYGHYAIDIAAGNGATIKSIINGTVTANNYDQWGNTQLLIENEYYAVLYLHGVYSPTVGDQVMAGQPIGSESNIGYTLDMAGNSCAGRNCGYHTHLNVFDKRLGTNIDPLTLIPPSYP